MTKSDLSGSWVFETGLGEAFGRGRSCDSGGSSEDQNRKVDCKSSTRETGNVECIGNWTNDIYITF